MRLSPDCCKNETERLVTGELTHYRAGIGIIPYFNVASLIAVIEENHLIIIRPFDRRAQFQQGYDTTTLLCRIQT
jgi:hypothetical protein